MINANELRLGNVLIEKYKTDYINKKKYNIKEINVRNDFIDITVDDNIEENFIHFSFGRNSFLYGLAIDWCIISNNKICINRYYKILEENLDFSLYIKINDLICFKNGTFKNKISTFKGDYNNIYKYLPIFLNEKYITDLGFNWLHGDKFYIDNFYVKYTGFNTYKVYIDSTFIKEIKYVHELQNLFYIIKNKELKINI